MRYNRDHVQLSVKHGGFGFGLSVGHLVNTVCNDEHRKVSELDPP